MTEIGAQGDPDSSATAINDDGVVVGSAQQPAQNYFIPTQGFAVFNGTTIDLGNLGSRTCVPTAINGAGWITGSAGWIRSSGHIFLYRDGAISDMLPTLRDNYAIAYAINAAGQVAGLMGTACGYHAFVLADEVLTDINAFGGFYSVARGINDMGVVAGTGTVAGTPPRAGGCEPTGPLHAFVYHDGDFQDLGTLGGTRSDAWAIDAAGMVVGESGTEGDLEIHACRWQGGRIADLGTLGGPYGSARAMNALGDVVGTSIDREGWTRAFLLAAGGNMVDLNTLLDPESGQGWTLATANGVNRSLQIVGNGVHNGRNRGFLLTPIP